jgi:hypothetical protein
LERLQAQINAAREKIRAAKVKEINDVANKADKELGKLVENINALNDKAAQDEFETQKKAKKQEDQLKKQALQDFAGKTLPPGLVNILNNRN